MARRRARVPKLKTWSDRWNDVIRLLYKDPYLKKLMLVPENCSITEFIDKYFVRGASTDEIVTDERVRILWYDSEGFQTRNPHVLAHLKAFDIYVKNEYLHNVTADRLQYRFDLITERLKDILLTNDEICQLSFEFVNESDLWTKTVGYSRYHVVFSYKTTI